LYSVSLLYTYICERLTRRAANRHNIYVQYIYIGVYSLYPHNQRSTYIHSARLWINYSFPLPPPQRLAFVQATDYYNKIMITIIIIMVDRCSRAWKTPSAWAYIDIIYIFYTHRLYWHILYTIVYIYINDIVCI